MRSRTRRSNARSSRRSEPIEVTIAGWCQADGSGARSIAQIGAVRQRK
jgi:hypothetical protein